MSQPGFRHDALIYAGAGEFLAGTVPFLREALEAGEPVLVAVGAANTALLEAELGADADAVRFAQIEELGQNPARIIPFWREFLDQSGGRPVRGIGEPVWPGRGPAEIDECERHESLLDVAFSPPPAWSLLCPYDGRALGDEVLEKVAHGGGNGTLRTWQDGGRLLVEFEDSGSIGEPLAGRLRPVPTQEGGRGLWLANQLCDLVQIRSRPGRTTVRLRASRH